MWLRNGLFLSRWVVVPTILWRRHDIEPLPELLQWLQSEQNMLRLMQGQLEKENLKSICKFPVRYSQEWPLWVFRGLVVANYKIPPEVQNDGMSFYTLVNVGNLMAILFYNIKYLSSLAWPVILKLFINMYIQKENFDGEHQNAWQMFNCCIVWNWNWDRPLRGYLTLLLRGMVRNE